MPRAACVCCDVLLLPQVNKLKACGLLGADLLHTLNGREYVTQKQLRQDVLAQLHASGGRLSVRGAAQAHRACRALTAPTRPRAA